VGASLAAFVLVYALVFGTGLSFVFRLLRRPVQPAAASPQE